MLHVFWYQWHLEFCVIKHLGIPLSLGYREWPQICMGKVLYTCHHISGMMQFS